MNPHIRIFPHSRDEFPSIDVLTTWMLTALKARGGKYLLRSAQSVRNLQIGSIVIFRHSDLIVGEAVVKTPVQETQIKERTLNGKEVEYKALVVFEPSSIRLYSPPMNIERLQDIVGPSIQLGNPRTRYKIADWTVYPKILAEVMSHGEFL